MDTKTHLTFEDVKKASNALREKAVKAGVIRNQAEAENAKRFEELMFGRVLTDWKVGDEYYRMIPHEATLEKMLA